MTSITLKILFTKSQQVKALRFELLTSVGDTLSAIREKVTPIDLSLSFY